MSLDSDNTLKIDERHFMQLDMTDKVLTEYINEPKSSDSK